MGEEGGRRGPDHRHEGEAIALPRARVEGLAPAKFGIRTLLDGLYRLSERMAAFCLAAIAALVVVQVTGRILGVLVRGADDLAGYALMASSFLALAPTLRAGVHIRVTLLLRRAPSARRRALELWCLALGAAICAYLAWHVVDMAWDAWHFGEMSTGNLGIPLWIPQSVMAFGILVLTLAFLDDLVRVVRSGRPSYPDDLAVLEASSPTGPGVSER